MIDLGYDTFADRLKMHLGDYELSWSKWVFAIQRRWTKDAFAVSG